uniref:Uncharacterized protein n=1 Tax=uncultured marine group II/III euryarchaeote KM3_65_G10 TaxID=1456480 RepID=A0A075HJ99_9EURY|nr:hypothetical protein [uncultured marine group II/III euryarchaeote KM3_65_G10]
MRRHVGRHPDRDAGRAVDQQPRQDSRQYGRLLQRAVVVVDKVDRLFVDIAQHGLRDGRQPRLGVTHRRGAVAVYRAEIALPVDQWVAQREILRHAHHRVVDGLVAVGMVFPHSVTDDARRFLVGRTRSRAHLAHREEHPPVDRLQPVACVGQGAAHDDRHGVFKVRLAHLGLDVALQYCTAFSLCQNSSSRRCRWASAGRLKEGRAGSASHCPRARERGRPVFRPETVQPAAAAPS